MEDGDRSESGQRGVETTETVETLSSRVPGLCDVQILHPASMHTAIKPLERSAKFLARKREMQHEAH